MTLSVHPLAAASGTQRFRAVRVDQHIASVLAASYARASRDGALMDTFLRRGLAAVGQRPGMMPAGSDSREVAKGLADLSARLVGAFGDPPGVKVYAAPLVARLRAIGFRRHDVPLLREIFVSVMSEIHGPQWTERLGYEWRLAIDLLVSLMSEPAQPPDAPASR
ncbi:MAG: hypothetical protein K2X32_00715 [Phycisphaerales bacterium]|nr:hypothetical protein [Phycisphaerales bacterium]